MATGLPSRPNHPLLTLVAAQTTKGDFLPGLLSKMYLAIHPRSQEWLKIMSPMRDITKQRTVERHSNVERRGDEVGENWVGASGTGCF